ncbi:hypothetical protein L195_g056373, partial [Trifolium pratense]
EFKVKLNSDGKNTVIICLYVDDLLITGSKANEVEDMKCKLKSEFEMTDLGKLSYFLGMEFVKVQDGIVKHQQKPEVCYSVSVISKFMHDPRKSQLAAAKRIFWYLKGTLDYE